MRRSAFADQIFTRKLPWISAVLELIVIVLLLFTWYTSQRTSIQWHGSGVGPVIYKFQDPGDTDGSNYYAVFRLTYNYPYAIEITKYQYNRIICDEDVLYSYEFRIYDSGRAELFSFDVNDVLDNRPDNEKNSPAPGG